MPGELREELEAAVKELEQGGNPEPTASVEPPAPTPAPAPAEGDKQEFGQQRDASGKFAPKVPAKDTVPADPQQGQEAVTPAPGPAPAPQQASRAPISWTPEERQGWEQMPAHQQQAVMRREREIDNALRQTAEARRFASEVQQTLQPYMGMILAEGGTPVRAIGEVMRTAALLRTAPPAQKATAVADMIMQFGIDVQQLDAALNARLQGRPMPSDPMYHVMEQVDQKLKPINDFVTSLQQRQQQAQQQVHFEAEQSLEQFMADPQNEFAMDVAEDMADLLELAARRGITLSLQDAYNRATMLHPSISKILEGRKNAQGAAQQTAAAQRARNAAVSVSGSGAPSVSSGDEDVGDDVRSAIGAAIKQHSGRR